MMRTILLVPGYMNANDGHWLSLWEGSLPTAKRVPMGNWNVPRKYGWIETLDEAIRRANDGGSPPILVAHGLGCIAIAHWAEQRHQHIHGALLVAPDDVEREDIYEAGKGFRPIPLMELPFTSRVVASSNDPFVSLDRAREFADAWRSTFTEIGPRGHINTASGFGPWARGEAYLSELY
jgi:hypothetical protein